MTLLSSVWDTCKLFVLPLFRDHSGQAHLLLLWLFGEVQPIRWEEPCYDSVCLWLLSEPILAWLQKNKTRRATSIQQRVTGVIYRLTETVLWLYTWKAKWQHTHQKFLNKTIQEACTEVGITLTNSLMSQLPLIYGNDNYQFSEYIYCDILMKKYTTVIEMTRLIKRKKQTQQRKGYTQGRTAE